jgi:hypothetical protein
MPIGIQPTQPGVLATPMKHVVVRVDGRWLIAVSQDTAVSPLRREVISLRDSLQIAESSVLETHLSPLLD